MIDTPVPGSSRPGLKLLGYAIGAGLLAAAIWVIVRERDVFAAAWSQARAAPVVLLAAAALLPFASIAFSAALFLLLYRRFARVPTRDMLALMASASLLNYIPLRPGLVGRVAFHRVIHGIPVPTSARMLVESMLISTVAFGVAAACASFIPGAGTGLVTAGAIACLAMLAGVLHARAASDHRLTCLGVKLLDTFAWSARYWVCFRIVGSDVSVPQALALAVASQAASLIPIGGNGLGLREWTVGLLASRMPSTSIEVGIAAELVNRAGEFGVALVSGVPASIWTARRLSAATAFTPGGAGAPSPPRSPS